MPNSYDTYKGYRIPDPETLQEQLPDTCTDKIPLGDNGMTQAPNGQNIHNIVAAIHNRMAEGLSPFILITGEGQTGKTTTALRIAYELHEVTQAAAGDFDAGNVLYGETDALGAMTAEYDDGLPAMKQVLIGDELGEQANANQHNSTTNMAWKMILNVLPVLGNCIIGLDPKSDRIDAKIRDQPMYRVWMIDKGRAKGIGRRYKGVDKKGRDKWTTDYFSHWDVPQPPQRYLDEWKPKELRYKLKQPVDYLRKLEDENQQATSFSDL